VQQRLHLLDGITARNERAFSQSLIDELTQLLIDQLVYPPSAVTARSFVPDASKPPERLRAIPPKVSVELARLALAALTISAPAVASLERLLLRSRLCSVSAMLPLATVSWSRLTVPRTALRSAEA